jgi:hypothetical protein
MSTQSKSYAKRISDAQVMLAGLQANLAQLERRGMSANFITALDANLGVSRHLGRSQWDNETDKIVI